MFKIIICSSFSASNTYFLKFSDISMMYLVHARCACSVGNAVLGCFSSVSAVPTCVDPSPEGAVGWSRKSW